MPQDREMNVQDGIPLGDGQRDTDDRIATGDRRDDVHLERRGDGGLRAAHLRKPDGRLPPDLAGVEHPQGQPGAPVQDVAVAPDGPSVWDARPLDDGHEHPGKD